MKEVSLPKSATFSALPPIWPDSLLAEIRQLQQHSSKHLVILDDDPTGTQTVHDIPLLTSWEIEQLRQEFDRSKVFFILTNSRSMAEEDACQLSIEIGQNLVAAAEQAGVDFFVLSRSDSTLRGHYPAEVDALCTGIGRTYDATIMVPFFQAGGRFTLHNTHYVQQGAELVPAAHTEFAKDKAFPFSSSYLPSYVAEKTGGRVAAEQVVGISIETIRKGGPTAVKQQLVATPKGSVIVINACDPRDLEVAVMGLHQAQAAGKSYIYRTAASFVRILAGMEETPLLNAKQMAIDTPVGGILFVGSHIKKSSQQLSKALERPGIFPIEIEVARLLNPSTQQIAIDEYLNTISEALAQGKNVVAYTSRTLVAAPTAKRSLSISRIISESICEVVQRLALQPRFLIAKGGITSNDIATKGLQVKRALVAGQLQAGVPVWKLGPESKFPGMHYVVYPGNVGGEEGLADALQAFEY